MFLGESEQALNEGIEGWVFWSEGGGTALYPVEFGLAAIIETSIISFNGVEPWMDVLTECCEGSRQIMSVVAQSVPKDNMYERFDIVR